MEKVLLHTKHITREAEKQLFQIPLPTNARVIHGIHISCIPRSNVQQTASAYKALKWKGEDGTTSEDVKSDSGNSATVRSSTVCSLAFSFPEKGDVFYTETCKPLEYPLLKKTSAFSKPKLKKHKPYRLKVNPSDSIIECFIEDASIPKEKGIEPYQVNIYIYYTI